MYCFNEQFFLRWPNRNVQYQKDKIYSFVYSGLIILHSALRLLRRGILKNFKGKRKEPETDLGLLQHPRWSTL